MKLSRRTSSARAARLQAGLSLHDAARKARIGMDYLRQVERRGAPLHLARRLAAIYQCNLNVFLPMRRTNPSQQGGGTPTKESKGCRTLPSATPTRRRPAQANGHNREECPPERSFGIVREEGSA